MSKINLFEDKEYEKMDWLNKAVTPYVFPINDFIASLPEVIDVKYEDIMSIIKDDYLYSLTFYIESVFKKLLKLDPSQQAEWLPRLTDMIYSCEIEKDTTIDFENKTLTGSVVFRKKKQFFNDEEIIAWTVESFDRHIQRYQDSTREHLSRLNEIQDLLGCKKTRSSKSYSKKMGEVTFTMLEIIREDKWLVRDVSLFEKSAKWIQDYVLNGNLASLSNFTRLKCMTHKGAPIYSMEETV